jgi:hypothetical protein
MPFHVLPTGEIFDPFSKGDKALQIGLFNKLPEAVLEQHVDDLFYAAEIFVRMPES